MGDGRNERTNCPHGGNEPDAFSALESAESHLAASAKTGRASDGSRPSFSASFSAFLTWGEGASLIRPIEDFDFFQRKPDGRGDEHQAWFDEFSNRWYKSTYPNRFGLAWGRKGSATPGEYLTRLVLQNRYFADDIQLISLVRCDQRLRVLTSQPHVPGEAALAEEIQQWFYGLGYMRLEIGDCVAWYLEPDNLLVADAHEGNVIRAPDGVLFAIDLNLIKPSGEMLETVLSLLPISRP
jgi:hypothetical protein